MSYSSNVIAIMENVLRQMSLSEQAKIDVRISVAMYISECIFKSQAKDYYLASHHIHFPFYQPKRITLSGFDEPSKQIQIDLLGKVIDALQINK